MSATSTLPLLPSPTLVKLQHSYAPPPSPPPEPDYSKWFEPLPEVQRVPQFVSFGRPMKEGGVASLAISEEKLKLASQMMRDWEVDEPYEPKSRAVAASQTKAASAPKSM